MQYLKAPAVKAIIHSHGKQISAAALEAIDRKIGAYVIRLCKHFNGHHKRIDTTTVELKNITPQKER